MRNVVSSVFCVLSCLANPVAAQVRDVQPPVPEITASGRGDVPVTPDRARLSVTIETHASSAVQAAADNAAVTARTIDALKAAGATEQDIHTSGYTVWTDYDNNGRRIKSVGARIGLRVEVLRIADLGRFVDAALSGGATQLQPIQFLGPKMDQARHDAMVAAVAKAKADAEILAEAAGGTLGELITLSSSYVTPGTFGDVVLASSLSGTPQPTTFSPTDLLVSVTALGRWRYLPRRQ